MKYILAFLIVGTLFAGTPHADDGEQLYRCLVPGIGFSKKLGGLYEKCLPPEATIKNAKDLELYYQKKLKDMELEHQQAIYDKDQLAIEQQGRSKALAMKWGNILLFVGIASFVIGIILAGILKQYKLEAIGNMLWPLGVGAVAVGAVLIGSVEHYDAIVWTVISVVVLGTIAVLVNGKGLEVKWPWKHKGNNDGKTKELV